MKDEGLHNVFFYLSRVVILVPLVVIVIALIFKFNQSFVSDNIEKDPPIQTPPVTSKIKKESTPTPSTDEVKFDLQGPMECAFISPVTTMSAFIKNRQISVEMRNKGTIEKFLVTGDCLYKWEKSSFSGKKICGISPILSLAETLAGFSPFGIGNLFKMLPQIGIDSSQSTNEAVLDSLFQSCKKKEVEDNHFYIPKNILFKNAELKDIVD